MCRTKLLHAVAQSARCCKLLPPAAGLAGCLPMEAPSAPPTAAPCVTLLTQALSMADVPALLLGCDPSAAAPVPGQTAGGALHAGVPLIKSDALHFDHAQSRTLMASVSTAQSATSPAGSKSCCCKHSADRHHGASSCTTGSALWCQRMSMSIESLHKLLRSSIAVSCMQKQMPSARLR